MSQQPNLPVPENLWARFTVDPRVQPAVRASDVDRDVAAEAINVAFSEGRLDSVEHTDRLTAALGAKQLGELVPLLSDITAAPSRGRRSEPGTRARRVQDGTVRTWIGLAILFNVIWVATWLFSGNMPYYYWPIWPMIGTAIPALMAWMGAGGAAREATKDRRRLGPGHDR